MLNLAMLTALNRPAEIKLHVKAALTREMWASAGQALGKGQDHTDVARLSEMLAGTTLGDKTKPEQWVTHAKKHPDHAEARQSGCFNLVR